MEDVIRIIEHLLETPYSIDRIDTIVNQLNISKDYLLKIINDNLSKDYFQLLHPSNNQASEKLALTFDVSIDKEEYKKLQYFLFFLFSFFVVHIMLNIVEINHVHFYIYVLIMLDQCIQNVQIKLVNLIMIF